MRSKVEARSSKRTARRSKVEGRRKTVEYSPVSLPASSFELPPFVIALLGFTMAIMSGCVKRTIVIETVPSGAQVWINEHLVGASPVERDFITHGRYKFRIRKEGYRELVVREKVRAPIYQWIPIDFFAEFLLPIHFDDRHPFTYTLSPAPPEEQLKALTPDVLTQALKDLEAADAQKRRLACATLAAAGDPAYAEALERALSDPDPTVRAAALTAWRSVRGKGSIGELLTRLRNDENPEVRWQAAVELEALGSSKAVPALLAALADSNPLVRVGAAEALKGIPDPQAVQPLIRVLKDRDTAVRRAAAEALGRIGDRQAVFPLIRVLKHHDFQTRRRAAESLRAIGDPAAGIALAKRFMDWDPVIRETSTQALVEFGDERVVPLLIRYLKGWKPWTREHAAQVLAGLAPPQAKEPLQRALVRESNDRARAAMLHALDAIKTAGKE